jgi:NADH-quinone oxidoreductase subunit G
MRVWFLKETKSVCTSCGTGCNIVMGSRENKIYRYEPRENDAVNSCWMCDSGRLNYKWINREDRLLNVEGSKASRLAPAEAWPRVIGELIEILGKTRTGSAAIIASARQTNEELYLLKRLALKLEAVTDIVPRAGEGDRLLLNRDRNPNTTGARLIGIAPENPGSNLKRIASDIANEIIKTLIVVGEDVTKVGLGQNLLGKLDTLIVSDILPNKTTEMAHYLLPGCAHAEKRGSFVNVKGRVQRFMQNIDTKGNTRPEWQFLHDLAQGVTGQKPVASIEGLFNQMAADVPAFAGLTWAKLGDLGVTVPV